jgi:hypothetical protein
MRQEQPELFDARWAADVLGNTFTMSPISGF